MRDTVESITGRSPARPVVVVGAGVAGLCCATHLHRRGRPVLVLEAADAVGGRVRTDTVDGFRLDRGFQVLPTAYPEARRVLDLAALRLGAFAPGALVRVGDRFERFGDPFRRPSEGLCTLASRVGTLTDKLRVARMRRRLTAGSLEQVLERPSRRSQDFLRDQGFSEQIVERFFRPFFGGVFLERELATSSRLLAFTFRMFASGDVSLPAGGMQAIPEQLATRLPPQGLRLGARVEEVEEDAVRLASGERIEASAVVVATAASAAARLVPRLSVPEANPATCLYFDAPEPPPVGPWLALDGSGAGPVNSLCVPSAVAEGYAPRGRALVSVSLLGPQEREDEKLEREVRHQLLDWFGTQAQRWRLLRVYRIAEALPRQVPGPFEPEARPARLGERLFVCGDHRDVASLNGAMTSGRRAAQAVWEELS